LEIDGVVNCQIFGTETHNYLFAQFFHTTIYITITSLHTKIMVLSTEYKF